MSKQSKQNKQIKSLTPEDINFIEEIVKKINKENKNAFDSIIDDDGIVTSELAEVIGQLMDASRNIHLKTEIYKPNSLAKLTVTEKYAKNLGMNQSSETLRLYQQQYLENMVSYKRHSREEITAVLIAKSEELKQKDEVVD